MPRLLFEKTGNAVWMSHLDLMRLFQRAFKRGGFELKHSQGFNPRPMVSIALPLSVGVESRCELLDFDLEGNAVACEEICTRLNAALVDGVKVRQVCTDGNKIKNLAYLDCVLTMEYDSGVPEEAAERIAALFRRDSLFAPKKGKNGPVEQDIIPMIRRIGIDQTDGNTLLLGARICCQNPTLNPMQLSAAVGRYLPELKPDFVKCARIEIYDTEENVFR